MKVLHITTSFPSHSNDISGPFILRVVRALEKTQNISCTILTPASVISSNWPGDLKVIRFRYAPRKLQILAQRPGGIPNTLQNNFLAYLLLPPFFCSMGAWILKLARSHDIIHAHWSISGFMATIVNHLPVITTLHGSDFNLARKNKYYRILLKRTIYQSKFVVAVSQTMAQRLKFFFPAFANKIFFIPNGVSEDFFKKTLSNKTIDKTIHFLFVGSLIPLKGVDVLIEALAKIKHLKKWRLTIVGDGPERLRLKKMCRDNELQSRIDFVGSVHPDRVPIIMENSDCLILPSYSEGRPSVVLEAMAASLPVIATDIEGTNELVVNGKNGWLFKPGDFETLANILTRVLGSPNSLIEMGQKGRQIMIKSGLTWENTALKYKNLYKKALGDIR